MSVAERFGFSQQALEGIRSAVSSEDLNGDGRVDTADLLNLLSRWGVCAEFP